MEVTRLSLFKKELLGKVTENFARICYRWNFGCCQSLKSGKVMQRYIVGFSKQVSHLDDSQANTNTFVEFLYEGTE